tara:strand:+ start:668 stop:862 length:195 start_codon:yes stop_codon:yes gene_type:complete
MRLVTVDMVIHSHLSDSLIEISFLPEQAEKRIRFVKFLISRFGDDLQQKVNIEKEWKEWLEKWA